MTEPYKTISYNLKSSDSIALELYLDEPPKKCYSMAGHFIGFAAKEKGTRYFLPVGCKIMESKGELTCIVEEVAIESDG